MSTTTAETGTNPITAYLENALHVIETAKGHVKPTMLNSAAAVLLISSKEKGLIVSVDKGTGVLMVHNKETGKWSSPVAVRLDSIGAGAVFG